MIFRDCMSVCMVYGLEAQKKLKIKKKEEERRLEGRQKRAGRRATHLFHRENIRELQRTSENCEQSERQRTVKTLENIRERQRTVKNIRERETTHGNFRVESCRNEEKNQLANRNNN